MSCPVDHSAQQLSPTGCPISKNAAAFNPFAPEYQQNPAGTLRWARDAALRAGGAQLLDQPWLYGGGPQN